MSGGAVTAALLAVLTLIMAAQSAPPDPSIGRGISASAGYAELPLSFEPNAGRMERGVDFVARSGAGSAYLNSSGAMLTMADGEAARAVDLQLLGAEPAKPTALDRLPGSVNDLRGDDPDGWRTGIPTFERVRYPGIYPGIDLDWHGSQRALEYDFRLAPGADPERIALRVEGADSLRLAANGDLLIGIGDQTLRQAAPVGYQPDGSTHIPVEARFELRGDRVAFQLGAYDPRRPLVIDPVVLDYSTYLGGNGADRANAIAVDSSGAAYLTGRTVSTDFDTNGPVEADSAEANRHADDGDVFITKLNPAGDAVVFSTYLGGDGDDTGNGIAVDATGTYIAGTTESTDFNEVNPPSLAGFANVDRGIADAFVAKLNPDGDGLAYSTTLGGGGSFGDGGSNSGSGKVATEVKAGAADQGVAIAVDPSGSAYVVGNTNSKGFPVRGGIEGDTSEGAVYGAEGSIQANSMVGDAFVTKFTPAGDDVAYSTFLGGNLGDGATAVAVDSGGSAYVAGATNSSDFNRVGGIEDHNGTFNEGITAAFDAFVAKINPAGDGLDYSTYLGGTDYDAANAIAIDSTGAAYVTGTTDSADFNTMNEIEGDSPGPDAFVSKLNLAGDGLEYSSYLGGTGADEANGIAVDPAGRAVLSGMTASKDFNRAGELEGDSPSDDAFVTRLSPSGTLSCSTYLGGDGADAANAVALDSEGVVYLAGSTESSDFDTASPVEGDSADSAQADAFASKLRLTEPCEPHPTSAASSERDDLQVFVIVLDGLRPQEINPGYTPQLNELKQSGTWYSQARSVFLAETLPNHAAMMTGVLPERSGLLGNDYWQRNPETVDNTPNGSASGNPVYTAGGYNHRMLDPTKLDVETLPTTLEESCDVSTAVVQSKGYLWHLFGGETPNPDDPAWQRRADYTWGAPQSDGYIRDPDDHTPDAAVMRDGFFPWLESGPPAPRFAFLNLGDIDRSGHIDESGVGAGVSAFRQSALADTDAQVRLLIDELKGNGTWDDTVLIFTSDHGMDWSTGAHITGQHNLPLASVPGTTNEVAAMNEVARVVGGGGTTMFYLRPGADPGPVADKLNEVEGIETVATRQPTAAAGGGQYPTLDDLGMNHRDTGDIIGLNRPGWRDGGWHSSTGNPLPGNHGHAATQHSTLFVSGGHPALADPPPGAGPLGGGRVVEGEAVYDPANDVFFRRPDGGPGNLSVAPTVAKLFGLEPPEGGYDGQPLDAAFEDWAFAPHRPCRAAKVPAEVSIDDVTVTEGDSGQANANFTVSLAAASEGFVEVDYRTQDASATAPGDYDSRGPTTLTFDPGETEKQVSVPVKGDQSDEPTETFTVELSAALGAELVKATGTATIIDDDLPGDADADGVLDASDRCPAQGGPASNGGCPLAKLPRGADCTAQSSGTPGDDTLTGTAQGDFLRGLLGADRLLGMAGDDCLFGGPGRDFLKGEAGADLLRGGGGRDLVSGGPDDDTISGGRGRDSLSGGSGDDRIRAQDRGRDRITCGKGDDEVIANPEDVVAASCEQVGRPA